MYRATRHIGGLFRACIGRRALGPGAWLIAGFPIAVASAHHSFTPHFDPDDTLSIAGVITGFEARNPHVYLYLEGTEDGGTLQAYVCESGGISSLERNGLTRLCAAVRSAFEEAGHRRALP